jgi:hypothetical protein
VPAEPLPEGLVDDEPPPHAAASSGDIPSIAPAAPRSSRSRFSLYALSDGAR